MHEYDREVVIDMLDNMIWALDQIQKRFNGIDAASDFLDNDERPGSFISLPAPSVSEAYPPTSSFCLICLFNAS